MGMSTQQLPAPKQIVIEIYDKAPIALGGKSFDDGTLAIMMSTKPLGDTLAFVGQFDRARFDPTSVGESAMYAAVPDDGVVMYTRPESRDNHLVLSVTNGVDIMSCPGSWCRQLVATRCEQFSNMSSLGLAVGHSMLPPSCRCARQMFEGNRRRMQLLFTWCREGSYRLSVGKCWRCCVRSSLSCNGTAPWPSRDHLQRWRAGIRRQKKHRQGWRLGSGYHSQPLLPKHITAR